MGNKITLEDLGYLSYLQSGTNDLELGDSLVARVIAEFKEIYTIKDTTGEFQARITGKRNFEAKAREDYPAVGDWVVFRTIDNGQAIIDRVLPRNSIIQRKFGDENRQGEKQQIQIIATNIDVAFIVEAADRDFSLNRFERYLVLIENSGAKPILILNKIDKLSPEELELFQKQTKDRLPGITAIFTSTNEEKGLDELKREIKTGKTYCFLGSSGVGKSSIINALLDEKTAKTGPIGSSSERGRHITTNRQMYFIPDSGIVIDNPGMREVGMSDMHHGIDGTFDEFVSLAKSCKYADCTHTIEPGCSIINAVRAGTIDEQKYQNLVSLKREAAFFEMNDVQRRKKDRKFGKFLKEAKKDLEKLDN